MYSRTTRSKPGRRRSKTACASPGPFIPYRAQAITLSNFAWLIPASCSRNSLSTWVVQNQVISGHRRATGILVFEKHLFLECRVFGSFGVVTQSLARALLKG